MLNGLAGPEHGVGLRVDQGGQQRVNHVNKTSLIEGGLLLTIGLVSMAEALRLILHRDPDTLHEPLGPGFYVFIISLVLLTTGLVHLVHSSRQSSRVEKVHESMGARMRLVATILVYILYVFLISIFGYFLATVIFFIFEFRIAGVRSWKLNVPLTLTASVVNYVIFVHYCSVIFPRGIFLI